MLQADKLSKNYGRLKVLNEVSLAIKAGEFVAIAGPSGAGKSTLLHLLGALDSPDNGSVTLLGATITSLSAKKQAAFRNQHMGFVFQFHHLLPEFSALENVSMPLLIGGMPKNKATKIATEVLEQVGLDHRLEHKPGALSGGEQQRVAIARAIVHKPSIVFADEPTGNLDTANAKAVHELFLTLRRLYQLTFVIVTHNEQLAAMADRVLLMRDGIIAEEINNTPL